MNADELEKYLKAGRIASKARDATAEQIAAGAKLLEIAEFAESEIARLGGRPAFPVNIAIDTVAAHYTPHSEDALEFKAGQVVKLDLGVHVDGYIADTALTVEVSTNRWSALISASRDALEMVLEGMSPGIRAGTVGGTISSAIKARGFEPVANLTGHSLERFNLHAGVSIPNIPDGSTAELSPGMAVAIEPFATNGIGRVAGRRSGNIYKLLRLKEMDDPDLDVLLDSIHEEFRYLPFPERWVARNTPKPERALKRLLRAGAIATYPILSEVRNGMVSQFEHTVVVTEKGCLVTTR